MFIYKSSCQQITTFFNCFCGKRVLFKQITDQKQVRVVLISAADKAFETSGFRNFFCSVKDQLERAFSKERQSLM